MGLPYFPMYPTDFEAKTSHLSIAEDGAYNRLLRLCWMTPGCSLPADEEWIMRRARAMTEADREAVRTVLGEFFTLENGRYSNARLTREFHAANEAHEKRKQAGAKGGRTKALKSNEPESSKAKAMPKQPEPEPEPVKRDTNVSLAQPEADASATIDRSRFADFWAMVPRKIGKKATEAAWKRLSRADQDAAKDSVTAWYRWFQSTHRDATPLYPERYLKHRRWEDEGWQDKPKAAPDREAAIAMHRKALTSPSEAVRRNAQDQLRKLGETI